MQTLKEARQHVLANLETGVDCPCCGQLAREYKRALNAAMAKSLIWLVKQSNASRRWVNVPDEAPTWLHRSRELPKLLHWGLIEQRETDNPDRKNSGDWRPTEAGRAFALNKTRISRYVYLYNNTVRGFSTEMTDIVDALDDPFNYQELMGEK